MALLTLLLFQLVVLAVAQDAQWMAVSKDGFVFSSVDGTDNSWDEVSMDAALDAAGCQPGELELGHVHFSTFLDQWVIAGQATGSCRAACGVAPSDPAPGGKMELFSVPNIRWVGFVYYSTFHDAWFVGGSDAKPASGGLVMSGSSRLKDQTTWIPAVFPNTATYDGAFSVAVSPAGTVYATGAFVAGATLAICENFPTCQSIELAPRLGIPTYHALYRGPGLPIWLGSQNPTPLARYNATSLTAASVSNTELVPCPVELVFKLAHNPYTDVIVAVGQPSNTTIGGPIAAVSVAGADPLDSVGLPVVGTSRLLGVAWGHDANNPLQGKFIAVGNQPAMASSPSGRVWTPINLGLPYHQYTHIAFRLTPRATESELVSAASRLDYPGDLFLNASSRVQLDAGAGEQVALEGVAVLEGDLVVTGVPTDATSVPILSGAKVLREFRSVSVTDADGNARQATVTYSSTTVSVLLQTGGSSSSSGPASSSGGPVQDRGAFIGIVVGAAVGGVLLAGAVVLVSALLIRRYTATARAQIRMQDVSHHQYQAM